MSDHNTQFKMQMYNQFWNNIRSAEESSWKIFLSYSLFIGVLSLLFEFGAPNYIIIVLITIFSTLAITMTLSANLWFVRNMYLISRVDLQFKPYEIIPRKWVPLKNFRFMFKEIWIFHALLYLIIGIFLYMIFKKENYLCIEICLMISVLIACILLVSYFCYFHYKHLSTLKNSFNDEESDNGCSRKIAVDVDSTLIDIMVSYCEIYNEGKNAKKTKDDVTDWDFFDAWGLTLEEGKAIFDKINLQDVPIISEDVDCFLLRFNQNYIVDIITNRTEKQRKALMKKLESMNLRQGINYRHLVIVNSDKEKLDLDYNIHIDDSPKLAQLMDKYPDKTHILLDQPWNHNIILLGNIKRVKNWEDIYKEIMKNE